MPSGSGTWRAVRPILRFSLALALLVAVAGELSAERVVDVSDPDNGGTVQLSRGDTLRVRLKSAPGTGYSWEIRTIDAQMLAEASAWKFVPPPKQIPGAEGHAVFEFRAAAAGRTTLEMNYVRPWERNVAPARIFKLAVNIE